MKSVTPVMQRKVNLMKDYTTDELVSELERRYMRKKKSDVIDSPEKAAALCADIRDKKQEYFVALLLDGGNRLLEKRVISIGTLTTSLVHPREVFAPAIKKRAAAIIVAHNHPSGDDTVSAADYEVTNRLKESGRLLGIILIDHLIITKSGHKAIGL